MLTSDPEHEQDEPGIDVQSMELSRLYSPALCDDEEDSNFDGSALDGVNEVEESEESSSFSSDSNWQMTNEWQSISSLCVLND